MDNLKFEKNLVATYDDLEQIFDTSDSESSDHDAVSSAGNNCVHYDR